MSHPSIDPTEIIVLLDDPITQIYKQLILDLAIEGPFDSITE